MTSVAWPRDADPLRRLDVVVDPGMVVSVATAGDLLQRHPHENLLVSEGAFSEDGAFHPLKTWDGDAVMKLFRGRLLSRLAKRIVACGARRSHGVCANRDGSPAPPALGAQGINLNCR